MSNPLRAKPKRIRGSSREMEEAAVRHRHRQTPSEWLLWQELKGGKLDGLKFRSQHAVGEFIMDFCCPSHRLVIEVDGAVHIGQELHDQARTERLEAFGYTVIRFRNEEIIADMPTVLQRIQATAIHIAQHKCQNQQ